MPSLRFAIENYFSGGRHPMAYVSWYRLNSYKIHQVNLMTAKDRTAL